MTITLSRPFGAGGAEPYHKALEDASGGVLKLLDSNTGENISDMSVANWKAEANSEENQIIKRTQGPVLDIGCGPGRMVKAATRAGRHSLGIDISPVAIKIAEQAKLNVVLTSVFQDIPQEGTWGTALLLDGNIGIGGDPTMLLARCVELISNNGTIIIEVHPEPNIDHVFSGVVEDLDGNRSEHFPWALIGEEALIERASQVGLDLFQIWHINSRTFCVLRPSSKKETRMLPVK